MKKGILLIGNGNDNWIGGLYYVKNIAFELSQNVEITKKYNLYLLSSKENLHIFESLPKTIKLLSFHPFLSPIEKILRVLLSKVLNIKYYFPFSKALPSVLGIKGISWKADFQHNRLPEMFSDEERNKRIKSTISALETGNSLVLSSQDSLNDLRHYYPDKNVRVYVIPFVSFIENDIREISQEKKYSILKKYNLVSKSYIYVANQFWKHKNHTVVLQAIKELLACDESFDVLFVFTGKMADPRNPEYIEKIKKLFDDSIIKNRVLYLGFLDRVEQLVVMSSAEYIIQPSLFEGWGTVVEDAKVLDKTILLSDIPVHREQMNEKCVLFDPNDPSDLAEKIKEECRKEHFDDIEKGIAEMYSSAKEYSNGFKKLLEDLEN